MRREDGLLGKDREEVLAERPGAFAVLYAPRPHRHDRRDDPHGSIVTTESACTELALNLEATAERYGAELPVAEFVNRSFCSECGARWPNISISLEPVATRGAKAGHSSTVENKP